MLNRPVRRRPQQWSPRSPRTSAARFSLFAWKGWRAVAGLLLLGFLVTLPAVILFSPANLECRTQLFTICSEAESAVLQAKYPTRWAAWRAPEDRDLTPERTQFPDWESVDVFIGWDLTPRAVVVKSQPIALVQIGSEHKEILSGGQVLDTAATGVIQFASPDDWTTWLSSYPAPEHALKTLATLAHDAKTLRPRPTSIKIVNRDQGEIRLENSSRAVIHLHGPTEVQQQLRTLQAVFTSSTMEQLPAEVDVRFKNVITR